MSEKQGLSEKKILETSVDKNANAEKSPFAREAELLSHLSLGGNKPRPPAKKKVPGANSGLKSQLPGQRANQSQVQRQGVSRRKKVDQKDDPEKLEDGGEKVEEEGMAAKMFAFTRMYERIADDADSLVDLVKGLDADLITMENEMRAPNVN
ncbi:unnamed protein product [Caenorhabditis brenneri]